MSFLDDYISRTLTLIREATAAGDANAAPKAFPPPGGKMRLRRKR